MKLKKIEFTVKNFILKIYFLRKIYLFLKIIKKSKKRYHYGENSEDALINSFFSKKKHPYWMFSSKSNQADHQSRETVPNLVRLFPIS